MAEDMLVPATLPHTPWDYLRRRRLLAGLTIAQAARPHWHRPEHCADVEANTRLLEQPGVVAKRYDVAGCLRTHHVDPDIYRQLDDLPMFHPTLCLCCCSSDMEPRTTEDGGSARIDPETGICGACCEDQARKGRRMAA